MEELKKKLYRRDKKNLKVRRGQLRNIYEGEKESWGTSETAAAGRRLNLLPVVFSLSLLFFLGAIVYAGLALWNGAGTISSSQVDLEVDGPVTVSGGEETSLKIFIANKNQIPLQSADLVIDYPEGTRDAIDNAKILSKERLSIGAINSGEAINKTIKAVFYGVKGSSQKVKMTLEYRLPDSSSAYVKKKSYEINFDASPVDLFVKMPKEINSNQEMSIEIKAVSNVKNEVHDIGLIVQYPPGFQIKESVPASAPGTSFWRIGDLPPGGEFILLIKGVIEGQDDEVKGFNISVGREDAKSPEILTGVYNSVFEQLSIKRSYVKLTSSIDSNPEANVIIKDNSAVDISLNWENTLTGSISNGSLEVSIDDGGIMDKSSLKVNDGYYNSFNNSILWDYRTIEALKDIKGGERDGVSFNFKTLPLSAFSGENPEIKLKGIFKATRIAEGFANDIVEAKIERVLKFATVVGFTADAYHSVGPFENSGPVPPEVGKETTYTVTWAVSNSSNLVSDAIVSTVLSPEVTWTGYDSPNNEKITYNPIDKSVTWDLGSIQPRTGVPNGEPPRSASFQVSLKPSLGQVGQTINLTLESVFRGVDIFTGKTISTVRLPVSIKITKDPTYRYRDDVVVQ